MQPRCLICAYDTPPIVERIQGLISQLKPNFELFCLVQFPRTLKTLESLGAETFLYRDTLGWEHGNLKLLPEVSGRPTVDTYESRLYGKDYDWDNFHQTLVKRGKEVINSLNIDTVMIWNGHTEPMTSLSAAAKQENCRVFYLERGFFPDSLFIDQHGTNTSASIARETAFRDVDADLGTTIQQTFQKEYRPVVAAHGDRVDTSGWSRPDKRYLFIEQLDHDTNSILFCDKFKTNRQAIDHYTKVLPDSSQNLLIKTHPESKSSATSKVASEFKTSGSISLRDLIVETDFILTRNSSVGLEGLIFNKPVATLGTSIYSRFALQAGGPSTIDSWPVRRDLKAHEFPAFLSRLLIHHHIFTNPSVAMLYPKTQALKSVMANASPRSQALRLRKGHHRWRHPLTKRIGILSWSARLALRSWRSKDS